MNDKHHFISLERKIKSLNSPCVNRAFGKLSISPLIEGKIILTAKEYEDFQNEKVESTKKSNEKAIKTLNDYVQNHIALKRKFCKDDQPEKQDYEYLDRSGADSITPRTDYLNSDTDIPKKSKSNKIIKARNSDENYHLNQTLHNSETFHDITIPQQNITMQENNNSSLLQISKSKQYNESIEEEESYNISDNTKDKISLCSSHIAQENDKKLINTKESLKNNIKKMIQTISKNGINSNHHMSRSINLEFILPSNKSFNFNKSIQDNHFNIEIDNFSEIKQKNQPDNSKLPKFGSSNKLRDKKIYNFGYTTTRDSPNLSTKNDDPDLNNLKINCKLTPIDRINTPRIVQKNDHPYCRYSSNKKIHDIAISSSSPSKNMVDIQLTNNLNCVNKSFKQNYDLANSNNVLADEMDSKRVIMNNNNSENHYKSVQNKEKEIKNEYFTDKNLRKDYNKPSHNEKSASPNHPKTLRSIISNNFEKDDLRQISEKEKEELIDNSIFNNIDNDSIKLNPKTSRNLHKRSILTTRRKIKNAQSVDFLSKISFKHTPENSAIAEDTYNLSFKISNKNSNINSGGNDGGENVQPKLSESSHPQSTSEHNFFGKKLVRQYKRQLNILPKISKNIQVLHVEPMNDYGLSGYLGLNEMNNTNADIIINSSTIEKGGSNNEKSNGNITQRVGKIILSLGKNHQKDNSWKYNNFFDKVKEQTKNAHIKFLESHKNKQNSCAKPIKMR